MIRTLSSYICKHIQRTDCVMSQKYFQNTFPDYTEGCPPLTENDSLIQNKVTQGLNGKWVTALCKFQYLELNDYSVYTGTSGIALLKLKKDPNNPENLQEVKKLLCLEKLKNRRQSFLCGDTGPLAIGIIVNYRLGRQDEIEQLVERIMSMSTEVVNMHSDLPNEYLYGRAGYLYAILFVNRNVAPAPFPDDFIRQIIEAILLNGKDMAKAGRFKCPLMYQWHDSYYLGAAHGLSGILYLLLQAKEYCTEDLTTLIKPTIDYLMKQRFPSGNFPSSLGRDSDKYVQWCHGAPGFLYLFSMAYKVFHEAQYLQVALECGDLIWQRGLLRKGYSLCHGVSGNAYCFLELYQTTKEEKHLYRALKFAEYCFDYVREREEYPPDRPLSLYEGIAGPMYLFLDIQKPLEAKFPGFTI